MSGRLVVLDRSGRAGKRFPLAAGLATLGRSAACDIRVLLPTVSQHHATITVRANQTVVRNVGSGATLVNGAAVSVHALRHGDELSLGGRRLRWEYDRPPRSLRDPMLSVPSLPAPAAGAGPARAARRVTLAAAPRAPDRDLQLALELQRRASMPDCRHPALVENRWRSYNLRDETLLIKMEAYTDVVELCGLLQCLGFSVRSFSAAEGNASQEPGARTVVINCPAFGVQVVLESGSALCSCPPEANQQDSGIWQVSGVTGGKQLDKEFDWSILGSLPKQHRERLSRDLRAVMHCIKEHSVVECEEARERANRSASMVDIKVTPERRHSIVKADTPTRYRSLDTLTATEEADRPLPTPGLLQKKVRLDHSADDVGPDKQLMCQRQSTYTLSSSPDSMRRRNETSSPLQQPKTVVLENLKAAERAADELRQKLASIIKQYGEDGKDDSSMSSLALDVSKISVLKGCEPTKTQFASSPNLSAGLGTVYEDQKKNILKRVDSASASNLMPRKTPNDDGGVASKLRRISPSEKLKPQDSKNSKLHSILKPKPVNPKFKSESSPNLSASKKRFSHIKSTIPRPTAKKD